MGQKKAKDSARKGPGRPTKFDDVLSAKIIELAKEGLTDEQIAVKIGIAPRTLDYWKFNHPEFLRSLKNSKSIADDMVEVALFRRATGYTCKETKVFCSEGSIITEDVEKHYPPSEVACIFWLKNRRPQQWRDQPEPELPDEGDITYETEWSRAEEKPLEDD